MLKGNILITGGSGTIGNAIVSRAEAEGWPANFTIYSRSELLQANMRAKHPKVSYVLGDVRDYQRLKAAVSGHSLVIHAAAMKRVPESEEQPAECFKTNVAGSHCVALACIENNVKQCIGISTDKACQPITVYGSSKFMMERIFTSKSISNTKFTLVRYGNVIESRGSVIPLWLSQKAAGLPLTITSMKMTRFWITPAQAVDIVLKGLEIPRGTIYVPKMMALPLIKMAEYIAMGSNLTETGLRSSERIHEYLVSPEETAIEKDDHFLIHEVGTTGHIWRSDLAPEIGRAEFLSMVRGVV